MSLATWKEEFYFPFSNKFIQEASPKELIEHSLKKWKGLTKENLEKHGLEKINSHFAIGNDKDIFAINDSTCVLCLCYQYATDNLCSNCPLYKTLTKRCDYGKDSPYMQFISEDNPLPMIELLEKVYNNL